MSKFFKFSAFSSSSLLATSRSGSASSDGSVSYESPTNLHHTIVEVTTESGTTCKGYFLQAVPLLAQGGNRVFPMLIVVPNHGLSDADKETTIHVTFQNKAFFAIQTGWSAPYLDSLVYLTTIPAGDQSITYPYSIDAKGLDANTRVSLPLVRDGEIRTFTFSLNPNHDTTNIALSENPFLFATQHVDSQGRTYLVKYAHIEGDFQPGDSGTPVMIHYKPDFRLLGVLSYQDGRFAKIITTGQQAEHELFGDFTPTGDLTGVFQELAKKKPFVPPTYSIKKSYTSDKDARESEWATILGAFEAQIASNAIGHYALYATVATTIGANPTVRGHHEAGFFKIYLDAEIGSGTKIRATYQIDSKTHELSFSRIFEGH